VRTYRIVSVGGEEGSLMLQRKEKTGIGGGGGYDNLNM
jgi:hypothetical protein